MGFILSTGDTGKDTGRVGSRPSAMSRASYRNILIIQTAFLGDVILITPLVRATKDLFPSARIDVLVTPETKPILANNPHIARVVTFDKRRSRFFSFWETARQLRKNAYDLAISPHSSLTTAYLMRLAGIPERLGFDRWAAAGHLTVKVPHLESRGLHKIKRNLYLLSVFTDRQFDMQTEVFPDEAMRAKTGELLTKLPRPGSPTIVICPGSLWFTKRWPEEHYAQLAAGLGRAGFNLVFEGGPQDYPLCRRIIEASGVEALNLPRVTTALESAAVMEASDLVICNDSAPVHMANAVKTDVFALTGPTDSRAMGYFPYRENDLVFELEMACRPCSPHGAKRCPLGHHRCMKDLLPGTVLKKVLDRLGS
jgi:heptosyltransferase-2